MALEQLVDAGVVDGVGIAGGFRCGQVGAIGLRRLPLGLDGS